MKSESEWSSRRARLCLKRGVTNLNAGTCSPVSAAVLDELQHWQAVKAEDPVDFVFRKAPAMVETARIALGGHLGCPARCLLLLSNATYAANTLARSLPWREGDEIVLSAEEYHHYLTLWQRIAAERGVVLRIVPMPTRDEEPDLTPAKLAARFTAAFGDRTRALFVSHVTSATGLRLPVRELCARAREEGIWSLIDGAHAPGLVDVSLCGGERSIDPDFYFANLHKWLMGATGSAFLYVRDDLRPLVKPLVTTGAFALGADARRLDEPTETGASRWCQSHEYQGTRDVVPLVVVPTVLGFATEVTRADLDERSGALAHFTRNRLGGGDLGFVAASHDHPELATAMVSFRLPAHAGRVDPGKAGVHFRAREQFEAGFPYLIDKTTLLRVSCAWFNTTAEVEALGGALARTDWTQMQPES